VLVSRLWLDSTLRLTVASVQLFDQGSAYSSASGSASGSASYNWLYIRAIN
jgi:hypothetical protein